MVTLATLLMFQGAALLVLPSPGEVLADWLRDLIVGRMVLPLPDLVAQWFPKSLILLIVCLAVVWIPLRRCGWVCRFTP